MYSVTVNNKKFGVEKAGDKLLVDGDVLDWDLQAIDDHTYHLIRDGASNTLELLEVDREGKTVTVKLNNKIVKIALQDRFDLLLEKLGMNAAVSNAVVNIKAPMPGLILEIS